METPDQQLTAQSSIPENTKEDIPKNINKRKLFPLIIISSITFLFLIGIVVIGINTKNKQQSQVVNIPTNQPEQNAQPSINDSTPSALINLSDNSVNEDIQNSTFVYVNSGIMLLNGINTTAKSINSKGSSPSYSSYLSKIAYVIMDDDNNIHIYDINTGTTSQIKTQEERLRGVIWSPDGNYLLTDSGIAVFGSGSVYTYPKGEKIATFPTISRYIDKIKWLWVNNHEFIAIKEYPNPSPTESENGDQVEGISKISLPGGKEQILVVPIGSESYTPLIVDKGILYFKSLSNNIEKFWQINTDGTNKKEISQLSVPTEKMKAVIKQALPADYSNSQITEHEISQNSENLKWVVFSVFSANKNPKSEICIMNLDNPQQSFKKIVTGSNPSW